MFGYVVTNAEKLTKEEKARFRRVYCGVCAELHRTCGARGRFILSNDCAFLALLLNALYEPAEKSEKTLCSRHMLKRHAHDTSDMTAYAADVNILLFYHSCLDAWRDEGSRIRKAGADMLKNAYAAAAARLPEKAAVIEKELAALSALEKERSTDVDAAAGCFGRLLGSVFAVKDDMWAGALSRMGDPLGRFIYILDARCDLEADRKSGAYNPLTQLSAAPDFDEKVYSMLKTEISLCAQAFETLPIVKDIGLIRNVLYSGVWTRYAAKTGGDKPPEGK